MRKSLTLLALFCLLWMAAPVRAAAPPPPTDPSAAPAGRLVRITFDSAETLAQLAARLDVWEVNHAAGYALAYINAAEADWLAAESLSFSAAPNAPHYPNTIPDYPCYRTIAELNAQLEQWTRAYSNLMRLETIGYSYSGRPLRVAHLTNFAATATNKPVFFVMANIHGRELITPETAMVFIQHLLEAYGLDADATWLLNTQHIYVLVSANPDGHIKNEPGEPWAWWRKNVNPTNGDCSSQGGTYGIDLNRNSSFKWGGAGTDPCDETYQGPTAASEKETQAIQNFIRLIFPDQRGPADTDAAPDDAMGVFITLHSYSNLVLWPWGHTQETAPNGEGLSALGRRMAAFNGYTAQQAVGLYPTTGSTDDWAYGELGIASYTFEIGTNSDSFYPSCTRYDALIEPNIQALLYAAKVVRTPYQTSFGPHTLGVTLPSGMIFPGAPATVTATLNDADAQTMGQTIVAAEVYIDTPPWSGGAPQSLAPLDGAFDESNETVQTTLATGALAPGSHMAYVRAQDASGDWGPFKAAFFEISDAARVSGRITDSADAMPLAGASVQARSISGGTLVTALADAQGHYALRLPTGAYTLSVAAFGYMTAQTAVSFTIGQDVARDFALQRLPSGRITAATYELGSGQPLTSQITIAGTPVQMRAAPTATVILPVGVYTLTAVSANHRERQAVVAVAEGAWATTTLRLSTLAELLLLDDAAGAATTVGAARAALDALSIPCDVWSTQGDGVVTTDLLESYAAILWLTGDDPYNSLTMSEQLALTTYLNGGGRLFLVGQTIGSDIQNDPRYFYREMLRAVWKGDVLSPTHVQGSGIFTGIHASLTGLTGPDALAPYDSSATPVFTYTASSAEVSAGLAVERNTYRLIYLGYGLEGLELAPRAEILRRGLQWLGVGYPPARLVLVATHTPGPWVPGQQVTVSLEIVNDSNLTAAPLTATVDVVPGEVWLHRAESVAQTGGLSWSLAPLLPEGRAHLEWQALIPAWSGASAVTQTVRLDWKRLGAPTILTVSVPLVAANPAAPRLTPDHWRLYGQPGAVATYPIRLENPGALTETYTLALWGNRWPAQITPAQAEVAACASVTLTLSITFPTESLLLAVPEQVMLSAASTRDAHLAAQSLGDLAPGQFIYLPLILRASH